MAMCLSDPIYGNNFKTIEFGAFKIDRLVYELYELTEEEIGIVEGEGK